MKPFCLLIYINCHLQTNTRMQYTHKLAHNPSTPSNTKCTKLHRQKKQAVHCMHAQLMQVNIHTQPTLTHSLPEANVVCCGLASLFLFHACTFSPINGKFLTHILSSTHTTLALYREL